MQIDTTGFSSALTRYDTGKDTPNAANSQAFTAIFRQAPDFHPGLPSAPSTPDSDLTRVRKAAGDLLAHALILPVLKQLRRSSLNKNTILAPGTGEKTFGPEFDMHIAERLAQSPRLQGLASSVAEGYLRQMKAQPATQPATMPAVSKMDVHG